ncbi:MAG: metal ABC transporter ATP-binding protein [Chloroflexales bacterium]|nr:metal ABC transporter ATP-binding protein [Chloroflexales bacterium]
MVTTVAHQLQRLNGAPLVEPSTPVLEVSGLTVFYGKALALDNVTFHVAAGERVALVGPNGAGKSTLFKTLSGLLNPARGVIRLAGKPLAKQAVLAYVPQRSHVDWNFPVNVADVVMMGRIGKMGLLRWPGKHDRAIVRQCLELVHMADLAHCQIGELSGGQQQRVFIARALAQEAHLLLLDEPITGLDVMSQDEIVRIIDELRRQGVAVLVATHDLNQAADPRYYERVLLLNRRLLGQGNAQEVFTPDRLAEAYGGQLRWIETSEGMMILADTCCGRGESPS